MDTFDWNVSDHALYSPDLMHKNFHLFRYLKHHLGGNHNNDDEGMKMAINSWLSEVAANFYEKSIQNLFVMYDKCLNKLRSYAEKYRNVCELKK